MTKVSVIIPTLPKNRDYLKLCVESLRATTDWDIIVVSNGDNQQPDYSDIRGITIHVHTRDQGQCNAVNIGAQIVNHQTDYIFIVNDDMYFAPGWDRQLEFEDLVFSPNLVEPANGPGSAKPFLIIDGGFTVDEFNRGEVDSFITTETSRPREAKETGFNFPVFVRKDVWQTVGGYDEMYDPWGSNSDSDLQAKFHYAGIQTMRVRDVLVYHFSNKSGTFDGTHQDAWQKNWDYFTNKWGFNRDMIPTDVWYSTNVLPEDRSMIKFKKPWENKYEDIIHR